MGKSLARSNRFLQDPVQRDRMVFKSVASSSAIEGIRSPFLAGVRNGATATNKAGKKRS